MVEDIITTITEQINTPIVVIDSVFIKYVAKGIVIDVNSIRIAGYNISVNGITT
jgi:hypothetical protein